MLRRPTGPAAYPTSTETMTMPLDDQHIWALLRDLDDPDHMEFPQNYDYAATRARFDQLAARLDQRFRCTCTVDRGVQDASHHGTIVIPITATASDVAALAAWSNPKSTRGAPTGFDTG